MFVITVRIISCASATTVNWSKRKTKIASNGRVGGRSGLGVGLEGWNLLWNCRGDWGEQRIYQLSSDKAIYVVFTFFERRLFNSSPLIRMILHRDIKIKRWKDIKRRRKPGVYTVHRYTVYSTKSIDLKTKLFFIEDTFVCV